MTTPLGRIAGIADLRPHSACGIMNRLASAPARRLIAAHSTTSHSSVTKDGLKRPLSADIHQELGRGHRRRHGSPDGAQGSAAAPSDSPNEQLRIGFIGVGGRAQTHLDSAIKLQNDGKVEVVAVCDVFNRHRKEAAEKINDGTKHKPKQIADYRDILNDKSIDAVVHRHARPLARQANDRRLKAGKHVYCEKPMTHSVEEAIDGLQSVEGVGPGDAGRRAVDVAARVEGRQQTPLRRPARQSADVPDVVLPQFRRGPVALLRAHRRT